MMSGYRSFQHSFSSLNGLTIFSYCNSNLSRVYEKIDYVIIYTISNFCFCDVFKRCNYSYCIFIELSHSITFYFLCIVLQLEMVFLKIYRVVLQFHRNILFPIFMVISKEVCLKGSLGHSREDILDSIKFITKNKIELKKFISKVVSLKNLQKTFENYLESSERNYIKIVVEI